MTSKSSPRKSRRKPSGAFHHGNLREAVLDAAGEAIEADGARKLSLRALGRALGVSDAAIHRHFKGRDAVLAAVGHRGVVGLAAAMSESADAPGPLADRMVAMGMAYVRYCHAHPGWFRLWASRDFQEGAGDAPPAEVLQAGLSMTESLKRNLAMVHPPEQVDDQFRMFWGLSHGLAGLVVERAFRLVETDEERLEVAQAALHCAVAPLRG